jgi:hypothetical protein
MEPEQKKTMLYIAGAIASVMALVLYMKNKQAASMPSMGATSGQGGSTSNPALAAEIQAQSALAQAQLAAQIQAAQGTVLTNIAGINANTQLGVANINASGAKSAAAIGVIGGATGGAAVKGILDILKGIILPGGSKPTDAAPTQRSTGDIFPKIGYDYGQKPNDTGIPAGIVDVSSSYIKPSTYDINGGVIGAGTVLSPDYYKGNIGGGANDWFGSSPTDASAPLDLTTNPFAAVSP